MKKLLTLLSFSLLTFSFSPVTAQWVTIPDAKFAEAIRYYHPLCMNGDKLDTTCNGVINAISFDCSGRVISDINGIQYFHKLKILDCSGNPLDSLPNLPESLLQLDCSQNYNLTRISNLPTSLIKLNCSEGYYLSEISNLPSSLRVLNCNTNSLESIPVLPSTLDSLICFSNLIENLPTLPGSLTYLNCYDNSLKSLPVLPNSLKELDCNTNDINSLPVLPSSLVKLDCSYTSLLSLPALPSSLKILDCYYNGLSNLPVLPNSLTRLNCSENNLSSLPDLPSSLIELYCFSNLDLKCLPQLVKFNGYSNSSFDISDTDIKCLPNKIQHPNIVSLPAIDTMPICNSGFNPNGCIYPCYAHFTLYPDIGTSHHWFALDESSGKAPLSYLWNWGDGNTSLGANASHTYSAAGYYKICVTITDDTLCTSTYCDSSTYISRMDEGNVIISIDVVSSLPTGSKIISSASSFEFYPNPVSDNLYIISSSKEIEIKDLLGRTIKQQSVTEEQTVINVSHFSSGIYFAVLKNEDGREVVRKFVKDASR